MAEGTRVRELNTRMGNHELKLCEIHEGLTQTRTEVTQQLTDMNQKMESFGARMYKMDQNFMEMMQLTREMHSTKSTAAFTYTPPSVHPRESSIISCTDKFHIIEEEQLQLRKYIEQNCSKIRDVEKELTNLNLEMKLTTAGPKKAALEHMRKKIEMSTERIRLAKLKEEQAKLKEEQARKAREEATKAVKDEEAIKKNLCEDLNCLMEARKWEDLNSECLVNVFGRLDLETKLLDIPLVCKNWYQALLNPLCWQKLVFPVDLCRSRLADHAFDCGESFDIWALIKFVVDRSKGCATELELPKDITIKDLIYVSDVCPSLKILRLPSEISEGYNTIFNYGATVSDLIIKWKSLEVIKLGSCGSYVGQIIDQIGLHCPNFVGLRVAYAYIDHEVASAIVSKLATIKYLVLNNATLEKEDLQVILLGCKELELLSVRNCVGFDEDDEEIIKLASRIKDFQCEGSKTDISDYDDVIFPMTTLSMVMIIIMTKIMNLFLVVNVNALQLH